MLTRWPGLQQVIRLKRTTKKEGKVTEEIQYAITSLSPDRGDAATLLKLWRNHWGIENRLHWVRDTIWREDRCRIRNRRAGHNMACFRNAAINLLRLAQTPNLTDQVRKYAYRVDLLLTNLGIMNF